MKSDFYRVMYRKHSNDALTKFCRSISEASLPPDDSDPSIDGVIEYCGELLNTHFYGEKKPVDEPDFVRNRRHERKISLQFKSKPYRKNSEPIVSS